MPEQQTESLDIIWGAAAIAEHIGIPKRKLDYLLKQNAIPARRVGSRWVARKSELNEFFRSQGGSAA